MLSYGKLEFLTGSAWLFPPLFSRPPALICQLFCKAKFPFVVSGQQVFGRTTKICLGLLLSLGRGKRGAGKGTPFLARPTHMPAQLADWLASFPR